MMIFFLLLLFCRTGRRDAICPFIKYVIRKNSCHTKGRQSKIAPPLFSNYIVCPGCELSCVEAGGKSIMQMAWRCRHNQPARVAQINNQLTCNSLCERSGSPLCDHCITQPIARMAYHLSFLCSIYNSMAKKIRVNVCDDQTFCDWLFGFRGKLQPICRIQISYIQACFTSLNDAPTAPRPHPTQVNQPL